MPDRTGLARGQIPNARRRANARLTQNSVCGAERFDQTELEWRLDTATAALRFVDSIIELPYR